MRLGQYVVIADRSCNAAVNVDGDLMLSPCATSATFASTRLKHHPCETGASQAWECSGVSANGSTVSSDCSDFLASGGETGCAAGDMSIASANLAYVSGGSLTLQSQVGESIRLIILETELPSLVVDRVGTRGRSALTSVPGRSGVDGYKVATSYKIPVQVRPAIESPILAVLLRYSWQQIEGDLPADLFDTGPTGTPSESAERLLLTGVSGPQIVFAENSLTPGTVYQFRVSTYFVGTVPDDDDPFVDVWLVANEPPSTGTLTVSATGQGRALLDDFVLVASGW